MDPRKIYENKAEPKSVVMPSERFAGGMEWNRMHRIDRCV